MEALGSQFIWITKNYFFLLLVMGLGNLQDN